MLLAMMLEARGTALAVVLVNHFPLVREPG
jgi:hypothetical protein